MVANADQNEMVSISQNEPANVLIISLHADPVQPSGVGEGGGTHAYVREILRGLALKCRYASVVTRHAAPSLPVVQRLSDFTMVHRIVLGEIAPIDKRHLNSYHELAVKLISEIIQNQKWPIHVLHGVYWNSGRAAMELSRQFDIPFVQTVISNGKRRLEQGYLNNADDRIEIETEIYHAAAAIFCISNEERNDLVNLYSVNPNKLHVIGRPVPLPFCNPAQGNDGMPRYVDIELEGGGHGL